MVVMKGNCMTVSMVVVDENMSREFAMKWKCVSQIDVQSCFLDFMGPSETLINGWSSEFAAYLLCQSRSF